MGAEHFVLLDRAQAPVDARRRRARLAGEHLELCAWAIAPGAPQAMPPAPYAECFVVPLAGTLALAGDAAAGDRGPAAPADPIHSLEHGSIAYWSAERGPAAVWGAGCRYLIVGWPDPLGAAGPASGVDAQAAAPGAPAVPAAAPTPAPGPAAPPQTAASAAPPAPAPPAVPGSPGADAPTPHRHGPWDVYRFDAALVPAAPGWRFFSVDGGYLTVGASYREALPPAREQPHSHEGEQINVALAGRFAFTVGDHTETLTAGWAALTPRGVTHTGLHVELPYFQLIFATPPRGRGYAEFLRSIYRPRD
jgi:hypothetical protein